LTGGPVLLRVRVGDSAHDQPAGDLLGFRFRAEGGEPGFGDLGAETHWPLVSSQIGWGYSIRVQASSAMLLIAVLTRGSSRTVTDTWAPPANAAPTVGGP